LPGQVPGLGRLLAYCEAELGTALTVEAVVRLRGRYCLLREVDGAQADLALLEDVARVVVPAAAPSQALDTVATSLPPDRPAGAAAPVSAVPGPAPVDDDGFADFTTKQRKLLQALRHRSTVPIADVKFAVYGAAATTNAALEQLVTRANQGLAARGHPLEIQRRANALRLVPFA
jgi:hypothetical protein